MFSTILFDLNRTLVTFEDADVDADYKAITGLTENEFWKTQSHPFSDYCSGLIDVDEMFGRLLDAHNLPRKLIPKIRELHDKKQTPVKGMQQLVKELHGKYKLVLVAGDGVELTKSKMEVFGLTELFDAMHITSEYGLKKDQEQLYVEILKKEGLQPQECLFIDDIKAHIRAATNVGIFSLLFNNVIELRAQLEKLRVL